MATLTGKIPLQAGANMIVSGTAVTGSNDQAATIKLLRDTVQQAI